MKEVKQMVNPNDMQYRLHDIFPEKLHDFEWIDGYFKTQALTAELEELTKERSRIATSPLPKADRMEGLKASFTAYQERRQAVLREFLSCYGGKGDAFRYFDNTMSVGTRNLRLPPALTFEEVQKAFKALPEADETISQKEREKKLAKLAERIEVVEKEIATAFPERYRGPNHSDIRAEFVRYWIELSGQCNAPVTPEGWSLEQYGTEAERAAWKKLRLGDFINVKDGLDPYKE